MKVRRIAIGACLLLVVAAGVFWITRQRGAPKRNSLHTMERLQSSLAGGDPNTIVNIVQLSSSLGQRTAPEQVEFLSKTLRDEVSAEGLVALAKGATFGPLQMVFPAEGNKWASQAGVKVEECVAFRMEKNGIRAEVVLVKQGDSYRVIRCNNVKQMAGTNL
jgi:hypothetical protein